MDTYDTSSEIASKLVTEKFSTSFSSASRLFYRSIRPDIYNIYGLVRIADEIVDTYKGANQRQLLDSLQSDVYQAIEKQFSSNIIVHAFALTANKYGIDKDLIAPFFDSMRTDIKAKTFNSQAYQKYIYGSAEVVGLMCLKVFCQGDNKLYKQLDSGARSLGSAFQKVNFLRDIKDDYETRGRYYFPIGKYETFDEQAKNQIVKDIEIDFKNSEEALNKLPANSIKACKAAYLYYKTLLHHLKLAPANEIKDRRIRVSELNKLSLLLRVKLGLI